MSSSAPAKNEAPPPDRPAASLSESEFLAQQAQAAKDAMAKAWSDFTGGMGKSVDPRKWAQTHPWITVASATVAGFAAATVVVPSKEEQALKKLAAIERALRGAREDRDARNGDGHHKEDVKSGGGFISKLIQEAIGAIRPLLMSIISAHLGSQPQQQQDNDAMNPTGGAGQPPPDAAYYQGPHP